MNDFKKKSLVVLYETYSLYDLSSIRVMGVKAQNPNNEPVRGPYGILMGQPSLPIPSPDWDLTGICTGVKQGFERGPYGQARAHANPICLALPWANNGLALMGPVRDFTGLYSPRSICPYHGQTMG